MDKILNDVTLVAISSIEIEKTINALIVSTDKLRFKKVLFLTDKEVLPPKPIEIVKINPINDIMDFNRFCFFDLGDYIDTSHALLVQYHGFVINPQLWTDEWLNYDYIGALWEIREGSYIADNGEVVRVGNGGFSLRSRKLMQLPKKLGLELKEEMGYYNEDGNICCYHRSTFLKEGINYAPVEIAKNFSFETPVPENIGIKTFGFHRNLYPSNLNIKICTDRKG
ncbi:MAG: hypothetical protein KatS3mg002_1013 [Candidatus Woesearchaeota archaeon]|jgi:hypothetical protein|nr:MAG: hypothetical protein KatS3mg002_1013 [Candidatus Woesearchaeota archaeon]